MTRPFHAWVFIGALLTLASPAQASPDPLFGGRPSPTRSVLPMTWDSAEPGTLDADDSDDSDADTSDADIRLARAEDPAAPVPAAEPAKKPAAWTGQGSPCRNDAECPLDMVCEADRCQPVERPINILYLYYRSGDRRMTEVLGIYWHRQGERGYRVLAPFYWHFWSPESTRRVVFPFYFAFDWPRDGEHTTIIPPFQVRRTPRETNYRFWPLFFYTDYGDRGFGLTLLPLFHYSREGERRSAILPLFLSGVSSDPEHGSSRGLILGVYYWHTEKDGQSKAVIPLFYHGQEPNQSTTWVFPLNFYWRRDDQKTLLVLPLFYGTTAPDRTRVMTLVPPLYYSRDKDSTALVILPLFFRRSSPESSFNVLFPIVWHFTSPGRSTTIAGPFFHARRGQRTTAGIVPLALYREDKTTGNSFGFVFPILYYGASRKTSRSLLLSPLFWYERDDKAKVRHFGLIAPPYYSRRDSEREIDTLIPVFLRWHNRVLRSTTWVFGPVVAHDDPDGGIQVVFPFFWRFSDQKSGAATSILFPLAYRHVRPDGSQLNIFFPVYFKKHGPRFSAGLMPLLFFGSSGDGTDRHAVLFPIFWHIKRGETSTTVLGPAFYQRREEGYRAGLVPLFFAGADHKEGSSFQVLFPLFWHLRNDREGYNTYVAGPGFYSRSKPGTVFGVAPLFMAGTWKGSAFQTVLPPLFYRSTNDERGESSLLVGPYYHWQNRDESGHLLLPLAYYKKRAKESTALVLPLFYYQRRDQQRLLVTPVGGFKTDEAAGTSRGLWGPFAWMRDRDIQGIAVLPLFFHWKTPAREATTTVVFPLGFRHVARDETAHVLFPFIWRFTDPNERSLVVFPFYFNLRQKDGLDADVFFPFYWHLRSKQGYTRIYGPVFSHKEPDLYQAGVFPLCYYHRNKQGSHLAALPFIYYRNDFKHKKRTWIVGPAYWVRGEDETLGGLAPIAFYKRSPSQDYTIGVPLLWHFGTPNEQKSLTFIGPWFYRKNKDYRATGVAPLFFTSWDTSGTSRSVAVMPLFYYRKETARFAVYTPLFGLDRSPERTQWYAGPYFRRTGLKNNINALFPIFAHVRNHEARRTHLGILPLLYYGNWSPEKSFHLAFPLFWRWTGVDDATTIVFPVVWDFNDRHLTRTTVVFPFFLRHRDNQAGSTSYLMPPGLWVRVRRDATDAVFFPLVWHFGGEKKSTTIGFPLYWDFKRDEKRTTIVFPLFWRFDRPGHLYYVVGNTYYHRNKSDNTYNLNIIPFTQVQRIRPGDLKVDILAGLFGYERIGRNRLMTLFFIPMKLDPVPETAPVVK